MSTYACADMYICLLIHTHAHLPVYAYNVALPLAYTFSGLYIVSHDHL